MKALLTQVLMVAVIVLVLYILYTLTLPKSGFRGGGGEAVGGRTAGSADSGATAELEPGTY